MAKFVHEIMNPELFAVTADTAARATLDALLDLGITAVPVLDEHGRPIGMTSIRDLLVAPHARCISQPALTVAMNATVEDAAETLVDSGRHHLIVVGSDGLAAGIVSSLDLVRALIGRPVKHPVTFPHLDAVNKVTWSDPQLFDRDHVLGAPDKPGLVVLSVGGVQKTEVDLWAESALDLRARVLAMLEHREEDATLAAILERRDLRFRCAIVFDAENRNRVLRRIRGRIVGASTVQVETW